MSPVLHFLMFLHLRHHQTGHQQKKATQLELYLSEIENEIMQISEQGHN